MRRDLVATHAPDPVPDELKAATIPDDEETLRLLGAICDALQRHWERSMAPGWPEMQLVLEADTAYRARQLATGGFARSTPPGSSPAPGTAGTLYRRKPAGDQLTRPAGLRARPGSGT